MVGSMGRGLLLMRAFMIAIRIRSRRSSWDNCEPARMTPLQDRLRIKVISMSLRERFIYILPEIAPLDYQHLLARLAVGTCATSRSDSPVTGVRYVQPRA